MSKETNEELKKQVKKLEKALVKCKLTESELAKERDFYRMLIDNLPDHVYFKDRESRFIFCNASSLDTIRKYTHEEVVGMTDFDYLPKDEAAKYYEEEQEVIRTGKSILDNEVGSTDRSHWSLYSKIPVRNENGKINGILGINRNINKLKITEMKLKSLTYDLDKVIEEKTIELKKVIKQLKQEVSLRKKTEGNLIESKKMMNSLIQNAPDIIYRLDQDGNIVFISDAVKLYGYQPDELVGKSILEIVHPDDKEKAIYRINERRTGDRSTRLFELRLLKKDKDSVPFELKSKSAVDGHVFLLNAEGIYSSDEPEKGNFIGTQGIARDITDRKKAEEALKKSEQRFREVFEESLDILYKRNMITGKYEYMSPAIIDIFGFTPEEIMAMNPIEIAEKVHPDDVERIAAVHKEIFEKPEEVERTGTQEYRIKCKNGDYKWIADHYNLIDDPNGNLTYSIACVRDISELKKSEEALRESEEKFRLISENIPVAVYSALPDKYSTIRFISSRISELTGYSAEHFLKNPKLLGQLIHPDDRNFVLEKLRKCRANKEEIEIEYRIIKKSKKIKWILDKAKPLIDENGEIIQINGFMQDITERKRAQEILKESEEKYKSLFNNLQNGIALHEIILDKNNKPVDYVFLDANEAYERLTGLKKKNIIGKRIIEITKQILPQNISQYADVALHGKYIEFETISEELDKYLHIVAYQPKKGQFAIVLHDISEQKIAENALKQSEEKYRTITNNVSIGIYRTTPGYKGKILEINKEAWEMFGYDSKDEFLSLSASDLYQNPNLRRRINNKIKKDGFIKNEEVVFKRKDGSLFAGSMNAAGIKDEKGNILFYDGFIEDITDRKSAEDKLKEKERYYRSLIDDLHEDILVINRDYKIVDLNLRKRETMSFPRKDIIGKHCYEVLHDFKRPCHYSGQECRLHEVFKTGKPANCIHEHIGPNNENIHADIIFSPMRDENGEITHVIEATRDITDIVKIKDALFQEKARLTLMLKYERVVAEVSSLFNTSEHIFQALNNISQLLRESTGIENVNWWCFDSRFYNLFQKYEHLVYEEMEKEYEFECKMEDNWLKKNLEECNDFIINDVYKLRKKERDFFLNRNIRSLIILPLKYEGTGIGALCLSKTEKYKWRDEMIQLFKAVVNIAANTCLRHYHNYARIEAEKKEIEAVKIAEKSSHLASLGTLAAGIAHEINQPLHALKIKVDSIIYWSEKNPEFLYENFEEGLKNISIQADRIDEIIRQMRVLAKQKNNGELSEVNINEIIKQAYLMIKQRIKAHGIEVTLNLDISEFQVLGHSTQLEQVIINLLLNAMNALDSVMKQEKQIFINAKCNEENCYIEVKDNGPGIPQENIDMVFDPFFTTKTEQESMGLGLSIVQNIITAIGGTITVSNNENGGACFIVTLPVAVKEEEELE